MNLALPSDQPKGYRLPLSARPLEVGVLADWFVFFAWACARANGVEPYGREKLWGIAS